jgi:hypothetical protein
MASLCRFSDLPGLDTPTEQMCALMWMQARWDGRKLRCPYKRPYGMPKV